MLFCKCTTEFISNYIAFYLKKKKNLYLAEIKKENSSNSFFITVSKNLLYLKLWSLFQPTYQKVILYSGRSWCLLLKQTSDVLTRMYTFWNLSLLKTHSLNLGHILKLVNFLYTLDCNVYWIYKHKGKQ